jgi:hypothetical protein
MNSVSMNPPPSYQEMCKMLAEANARLERTIAENKAKEMKLQLQIHFTEEAMKTYQRAYHRISTQECIQEEKIRRLEGRL